MRIRQTKKDRLFDIINYSVLSIILVAIIYPLLFIISSSFSSTEAVTSGRVWLFPVEPTLVAYKQVIKDPKLVTSFMNSIMYVVLGTVISVSLTLMAGYPLSRRDLYGKNFIMMMFTFTMLFSGGLIPTYLVVNGLNMTDKIWAMVIPSAISVWNVILARTYFQASIPNELIEAAEIDGYNDFGIILKVVLPLSGPITAVMVLFYAVGQWNAYFDALIYLKTSSLYPLQITLRNILIQSQMSQSMLSNVATLAAMQGMKDLIKYALIVIASVPVLMIYPFVQSYFVKGVMVGAIKG